ncbi:glycosyltransferase [Novipirellula rosea]|uniref:Glycosyltransferase n=1 Tax=Novipirellula rosea TaxID=1031540 RepID=A0ABP8MM24_9BACT|tara:strand:- start:2107 stop:3225 length:1119 start_codon:yes stop_codon:yes gene_type:complete
MIAENKTDRRIHVMHMTDTLDLGGRERIAVELVNQMPRDRYRTSLCTTRRDGPLSQCVSADVGRICLHRKHTFDLRAIRNLVKYNRDHRVDVLHAHGSSILVARMAAMFSPHPAIIWHDHYGTNERKERSTWLFRLLLRHVGGVVAVSKPLADWSQNQLHFRKDRIWCLPNFVDTTKQVAPHRELPGRRGSRIVCVANVRPVKDHLTLIRAMQRVVIPYPDAHLLLVGAHPDANYLSLVQREIQIQGLQSHVTLLGIRQDVTSILEGCDIGVLSSTSEGLPVSLLEYGATSMSVVATRVGQCGDVLDDGKAGLLVPASEASQLANAIISLLADESKRKSLGRAFFNRVQSRYSAEAVIGQLSEIYETVLGSR